MDESSTLEVVHALQLRLRKVVLHLLELLTAGLLEVVRLEVEEVEVDLLDSTGDLVFDSAQLQA